MPNKKIIYVVTYKHYGDDFYCGCEFHPMIAFKNEEDAKEFAKQNEDYVYEEISLEEK